MLPTTRSPDGELIAYTSSVGSHSAWSMDVSEWYEAAIQKRARSLTTNDIVQKAENGCHYHPPCLSGRKGQKARNNAYIWTLESAFESPGGEETEAAYSFETSGAGDYKVLDRITAPDIAAYSFYISVDEGEKNIWDTP